MLQLSFLIIKLGNLKMAITHEQINQFLNNDKEDFTANQIDFFGAGSYHFILSDITLKQINQYYNDLVSGQQQAGVYLQEVLQGKDLNSMKLNEFIEHLIHTKKDCIFAEATDFTGDNNWNGREVALLGDISCVVEAKIFDNGLWSKPTVHVDPLDATLIYVPGVLLEVAFSTEKPDYNEVCPSGQFNFEHYYKIYERRLLPGLLHANQKAVEDGQKLFITIPGIGCGQFAGTFQQNIHAHFQKVIENLLEQHGSKLTQVQGVWYDNYDKKPAFKKINGIDLYVKPLIKNGLPQLCHPKEYDPKFKDCHLVSFVAWDHVSKPGNDYWKGSRATDDGVKAAASNTMEVLTGLEGVYNPTTYKFVNKSEPSHNWSTISQSKKIQIPVQNKLLFYPVCALANENAEYNAFQTVEKNSLSTANISMMVLGGFIAAVGISVVAIAFTVLNASTFGISGLVVAGFGVACTLSSLGLFSCSSDKDCQITKGDSSRLEPR